MGPVCHFKQHIIWFLKTHDRIMMYPGLECGWRDRLIFKASPRDSESTKWMNEGLFKYSSQSCSASQGCWWTCFCCYCRSTLLPFRRRRLGWTVKEKQYAMGYCYWMEAVAGIMVTGGAETVKRKLRLDVGGGHFHSTPKVELKQKRRKIWK